MLGCITRAGLEAVELYLSKDIMADAKDIIDLCKAFPLKYSLHAPNDDYEPLKLAELAQGVNAEVIVFHNIFWESEWENVARIFNDIRVKLCIENVSNIHEPLKFMRRYGMGRCLDLEHLQMECCGFYEEEFVKIMREASHIHLTGYTFGSELWHTHIHQSPEHNLHILGLLAKIGYSGFVVSEAKLSLQTYDDFKKLNDFCKTWRSQVKGL